MSYIYILDSKKSASVFVQFPLYKWHVTIFLSFVCISEMMFLISVSERLEYVLTSPNCLMHSKITSLYPHPQHPCFCPYR